MDEPTFTQKQKGAAKAPKATEPAPATPWVFYFRVSTTRQGESGLGLEAQRESVTRYIAEKGGAIIAEFTEVESGKKASNRPELQKAMETCRRKRATLPAQVKYRGRVTLRMGEACWAELPPPALLARKSRRDDQRIGRGFIPCLGFGHFL